MNCIVEECLKKSVAKGLCAMHYKRKKLYGDINRNKHTEGGRNVNWLKDFLSAMPCVEECFSWPFAREKDGYPRVKWNGRKTPVSRIVCEEVNGSPPTPEYVTRHTCNNGKFGCINPNHLIWGTTKDNIQDQVVAGTRPKGEIHKNSKLNNDAVLEIYQRRMAGESLNQIAKDHGIDFSTVSDIARGRTWSWLTGAAN